MDTNTIYTEGKKPIDDSIYKDNYLNPANLFRRKVWEDLGFTRLVVDAEGRLLCTVEQARALRYRASRLVNRTQVYFYTQYWLKFRQYDVINHKRTLLSNN